MPCSCRHCSAVTIRCQGSPAGRCRGCRGIRPAWVCRTGSAGVRRSSRGSGHADALGSPGCWPSVRRTGTGISLCPDARPAHRSSHQPRCVNHRGPRRGEFHMTPGWRRRETMGWRGLQDGRSSRRREARTAAIAEPTPENVPTKGHPHLPRQGLSAVLGAEPHRMSVPSGARRRSRFPPVRPGQSRTQRRSAQWRPARPERKEAVDLLIVVRAALVRSRCRGP